MTKESSRSLTPPTIKCAPNTLSASPFLANRNGGTRETRFYGDVGAVMGPGKHAEIVDDTQVLELGLRVCKIPKREISCCVETPHAAARGAGAAAVETGAMTVGQAQPARAITRARSRKIAFAYVLLGGWSRILHGNRRLSKPAWSRGARFAGCSPDAWPPPGGPDQRSWNGQLMPIVKTRPACVSVPPT